MAFVNIDRLIATIVRAFLILHNLLLIWRLKEATGRSELWFMGLTNLAIVLEGLYFVFQRDGKELKWISPLFLIFLFCELPSIWLLELNNFDVANTPVELENNTGNRNETAEVDVVERILGDLFTPGTWILMLEETLAYMMVTARWLLPRGKLSRAMLSEILLIYVGIASDVMEFFSLVSEDHIRSDLQSTYLVLGVWSVSCMQFTYTIVLSRKKTGGGGVGGAGYEDTIAIETVSVVLSFFMQDGPFLCVRLYIMIHFNLLTYSIVFFVIKNVIVVVFLGYRLSILCTEIKKRAKGQHKDKGIPIVDLSGSYVREKADDTSEDESKNRISENVCQPPEVTNTHGSETRQFYPKCRDVATNTDPLVVDDFKMLYSLSRNVKSHKQLNGDGHEFEKSTNNLKRRQEVFDAGYAAFRPLGDSGRASSFVRRAKESEVDMGGTLSKSPQKHLHNATNSQSTYDDRFIEDLEAKLLHLDSARRRRFHGAIPHSVRRRSRRRRQKYFVIL